MANIEMGEGLFPVLGQAFLEKDKPLTGVARLAAEAEATGDRQQIEFRAIKVRSILNWSRSKRRAWTAWSVNPYRGCEFGCKYCYARYTHTFMASTMGEGEYADPKLFEQRIFIKQNAPWLVEQELRKVRAGEEIAIGTATDPYQPAERVAQVTRSILEVLARYEGLNIGIITKSDLIVRDIDLLQTIARQSKLSLHITITTPNIELARKLEPRAPRPDLRFATVRELRKAGLRAGILNCPLLPGITDNAVAMNEMARLAKAVDANFLVANTLFLKPCSKSTYMGFVREHFPDLLAFTEKRFEESEFAPKPYAKRMSELLRAVCRKHGVGERSLHATLTADGRKPVRNVHVPVQGRLFG
jgi:DNA repair photolyase